MKRLMAGAIAVLAFVALPATASAAPNSTHGRARAAAIAARNHVSPVQGNRSVATHTSYSTNWSGYVSCFVDATTSCNDTFQSVTGTWTEPVDDCSAAKPHQETVASFWAGLDGFWSPTVEQTGTDTICLGNTQYDIPWVEFYPARPITLSDTVYPGDTLTATVSQDGTNVTATLTDETAGHAWTDSRTSSAAGLAFNSAEWIAEAVTNRLTDFGTVTFSDASATDTTGHTGPINDGTWGDSSITMVTKRGGPFHSVARAAPGDLIPNGTGFDDVWMHL